MSNTVLPNTYIIGIQKAGTTTLDGWLAQHPQIYCYGSLKDVHLFARYNSKEDILQRLKKEPDQYRGQPVVLQSAVNYIFYTQLLQKIAAYTPQAKLVVILRNPINRAISSYGYFKKMMREKRPMAEALIYEPKTDATFEFSNDNSDLTYIEHGFYAKQIKNCLAYFSKEQLLVLDYDDLANDPSTLLRNLFSFLAIDPAFQPDLALKNITGSVKSQLMQETIINKQSGFRKWIVDNLIDPIFPVGKRKMLKRKLFELNTVKKKSPQPIRDVESIETIQQIKQQLKPFFIEDAKELDDLLGTNFSNKWFDAAVTAK